jgi:hypothetical protein
MPLAVLRQARSDQEALASAPGATDDASNDLGYTIGRIGTVLGRAGKLAEAEAEYRRALVIQ